MSNILLNESNYSSSEIIGAYYALGLMQYGHNKSFIDTKILTKLMSRHSRDLSYKTALGFTASFIKDKKMLKIANEYMKDNVSIIRRTGALVASFHRSEKDLHKIIRNTEKLESSKRQGYFLGTALQGYSSFYPALKELILKETDEQAIQDYLISLVLLGTATDPTDISNFLIDFVEKTSKHLKKLIYSALSLLVVFQTSFESQSLILNSLFSKARLIDQMYAEICLVILLSIYSKEQSEFLWQDLQQVVGDPQDLDEIRKIWSKYANDMSPEKRIDFLLELSASTRINVQMSALYASFFHEFRILPNYYQKLSKIASNLLNNSTSAVRDIAVARLISYSLSRKDSSYVQSFWQQIAVETNPHVIQLLALALSVVNGRLSSQNMLELVTEIKSKVKHPSAEKGALIGVGIANNEFLKFEWVDEQLLGYLEIFEGNVDHGFLFLLLSYYIRINSKSQKE